MDLSMSSYSQIVKSSSIVGGAQAANLVIGLLRTKLVAILLGPAGVGLIGLYQAALGLAATISGMGISSSAIRQIADANGTADHLRVASTAKALQRAALITGIVGTILTISVARPLSVWTFGSTDGAKALAILAITVLFSTICSGQTALLQGLRRISDLAKFQVFSALGGTIGSVLLYLWLRNAGIVPALILVSLVNLACSAWLKGRMDLPFVNISWLETALLVKSFVSLGLAFMWSAFLLAGVTFATRTMIVQSFGTEGNGIYQAAWAVSGLFAGFILQAMGTDFYPRLTSVASDNLEVNRLVNEQTEIGILLALPGLLGTISLSPWVIQIMYSAEFFEASLLLPWFVVGVFGRVVSWPVGFIMLAKGAGKWFAVSETTWALLQVFLVWIGLKFFGLKGAAIGFALMYLACLVGVLWIAWHLSGFHWSSKSITLVVISSGLLTATFLLSVWGPTILGSVIGATVAAITAGYCLREVCIRLGRSHRISQIVYRFPIVGPILTR